MTFEEAIQETPALKNHLRQGLQALAAGHAAQVRCRPTTRLRGSVFLDPVLDAVRPGAPSWDYAVGWESLSGPECVCFAEMHPANNEHVRAVINKKRSVLGWLRSDGPLLRALAEETARVTGSPVFHWLATGAAIAIRPGTPQSRMLQEAGIAGPKRRLDLP